LRALTVQDGRLRPAPRKPNPKTNPTPQVGAGLALGLESVEAWPRTASLSVARVSSGPALASLAAAPGGEEAFLVALQQQIARVGARRAAPAGGGGGSGWG
jgi:hypothetical protein